jgi:hypothetical protein
VSLAKTLEVPLIEATKLLVDDREGYVLPATLIVAIDTVALIAKGSLLIRSTINAYITAIIEL